ncbi:MAG: cytochrome c biogenesis protein CcsA [Cyclobacteriaceae bacterium]|nr:cytochrome c biogenesis protein CcsA [Cyclobacteriaceae bacterium]
MKFLKHLFSMSFSGALLLVFGVSIGVATFIENDFGPIGSQSLVYRATWFEVLMGVMVVNMIGVIVLKKMYKRERWVNLLFHVAFIIILIGAGITRFFGEEGMMHIREGESSNTFISEQTYINAILLEGDFKREFHDKVLFSRIKNNRYSNSVSLTSGKVNFKMKQFIFNATQIVEHNEESGAPMLTLVIAGDSGRENRYFSDGEVSNLNGMPISFNALNDTSTLRIIASDSGLVLNTPFLLNTMSMDTREMGQIEANKWVSAAFRTLYTVGDINFVITGYDPKGRIKIVSAQVKSNGQQTRDAIVMEVSGFNQLQEVLLFGGRGYESEPVFVEIGGVNMSLSYGAKIIEVPFTVTLKDFQLDRYPGSMSPSSYASEVVVTDGNESYPFRIYMNHILDHGGYRFFQSSYDQDELGTVLSVNKDRPGTIITYIGYTLLFFGLIAIIFSNKTRFRFLSSQIDRVHKKRQKLVAMLMGCLLISSPLFAMQVPEVPLLNQAEAFGRLIYQTNAGRMTPINSLASDLLRKVYKSSTLEGYTPEQVMLGMMSNAHEWQNVPMILVKDEAVESLLGINSKYASYNDFFNDKGAYKLIEVVNAAYAKKPAMQSTFDKALMKVDERVNIAYMVYQGMLLKVFPVPNDLGNHWVSPLDEEFYTLTGDDSVFVRNGAYQYFRSIAAKDYEQAELILNGIKKYQRTYGGDVMPTEQHVSMEINFNKWNIFKNLFPYYLLVGFGLMIVVFITILSPKYKLKLPINSLLVLIILGFIAHTGGLGMRWYISGHAPWSNGYEAMVYIAWATVLAGLLFSKKSPMTLGVTAFLSGIILFVANLSFLDPQITNLVPVLKSYWLTIHVATITASYGFMALGALLAFLNLSIMMFKTDKNNLRLSLSIEELTYVIEMALTIGIILLTIGNFLGGVWANESWGRYWGWDPKETWALASIIFYAFVLHMRFIPGLKGVYAFNLAALVTFGSIIMTFFGVNYYLSGLHSYAAGDPMPIPSWVYYSMAIIAVLGGISYWRNYRFEDNNAEKS